MLKKLTFFFLTLAFLEKTLNIVHRLYSKQLLITNNF